MTPEGGAAPAPSLAELLRAKTPKRITKQQAAKIQEVTLDPRSSTAAIVNAVEQAYADGTVTLEDATTFKKIVKSPEAQSTKTRKKVRQAALNALNIPEIAAPVQLELDMFMGIPEQLKQEPMPGAEERVAAATAKVEADRQAVVDRAIKKVQDKRMMESAKTPSSLAGGRMEEMYNLVQNVFSKKPGGALGPIPRTPSSLESMSSFRADIDKAFTPQVAERLTRSNPLVRREEIAVQLDTRTQAQRKKHSDQMLALAKRENAIQFREQKRMENLEAKLDSLQARQRKSANAERAKEIGKLLEQRDRMDAETNQMLQAEREAAKARAMAGEAMESTARSNRTAERASVMEALLQERDAQNALIGRTLGRQRQVADRPRAEAFGPKVDQPMPAEVMPEAQATVPAGKIESSEVPVGINLFKTKSGKFKVLLSSGQAIGITDEYRDAVKLAQKYATKKLASRKSVR
jgi:hypothetical protein